MKGPVSVGLSIGLSSVAASLQLSAYSFKVFLSETLKQCC